MFLTFSSIYNRRCQYNKSGFTIPFLFSASSFNRIHRVQRPLGVAADVGTEAPLEADALPLEADLQKAKENAHVDTVEPKHPEGRHDAAEPRLAAAKDRNAAVVFYEPRLRIAGARREADEVGHSR